MPAGLELQMQGIQQNQQQQALHQQQQQQQGLLLLQAQLPDTIPDFGTGPFGMGQARQQQPPFGLTQNDPLPLGLSPQPPSAGLAGASGLCLDSCTGASGGPYVFHQTPSGSTLCQLGGVDPNCGATAAAMCSPASSQSGSQPRLVHLSGSGANDSGLSSLSGGFCPGQVSSGLGQLFHQQHNFSPEVRGELEELEPVPRDRCNTWPLRRAMGLDGGGHGQAQTSPLIHDRIPEEESMYEEEGESSVDFLLLGGDAHQQRGSEGTLLVGTMGQSPTMLQGGGQQLNEDNGQNIEERSDSALGGDFECCSPRTESPPSGSGGAAKKSSTRRNAWGNLSYADLITQAILAAPEKRLTLSQVYEWMVQNVPYFRDKGDSNSSAGWKNSIRHNLSLHSRFMRIQNEGAGKSSWWVINPDAKPGRNPRRRANTMENASKAAMDKKRRGARKRVEQLVQQKNGGQPGPSTSAMASMQELFEGAEEATEMGGGGQGGSSSSSGANFDTFRPRAQSTLSVTGPSRLSPKLEPTGFEDFDFPPWMDQSSNGGTQKQPQQQLNPQVNELLDRTDQMRLDGQAAVPIMNGIKMESIAGTTGPLLVPKSEVMEPPSDVKQEPGVGNIPPPPSYQELSAVRRPVQLQSNPLLRQLDGSPQQQMMSPLKMTPASMSGVGQQVQAPPTMPIFTHVPFGAPNASFPQQWNPPMSTATSSAGHQMMMAAPPQYMGLANGGALPLDLENVNGLDQSLLTDLDVDAVLRHELAQGGQFDLP